ncbi:Uncharacterised protein [Vibrio cholerae]|nr:Uncharacterised protein [Vibrio cholerae]
MQKTQLNQYQQAGIRQLMIAYIDGLGGNALAETKQAILRFVANQQFQASV